MAITDETINRATTRLLNRGQWRDIISTLKGNVEADFDMRRNGDFSPNDAIECARKYERDANCLYAFLKDNYSVDIDAADAITSMADTLMFNSRQMKAWATKVKAILAM